METTGRIDHSLLRKLRLRIETDGTLRMKKLKIRGKELGHIPKELCHIHELEILDLSPEREACLFFKLIQIPPGIERLVNLRVLMLDTNELEELPVDICLLTNLQRLSLSNNKLTSLPGSFSSLRNLQSLHLSNNKFVVFPPTVIELEQLTFLDLADNHLDVLPESISRLQNLRTLILFLNQLAQLPASICRMLNLCCLWLGDNRLTRLPDDFPRLQQLDWGQQAHTQSTAIDGNPMEHPPVEVCKRGVLAIQRYFENSRYSHDTKADES